ncbi:MAG: hypothetical protein ACP5JN_04265 [Candidatus Micrarchaeia archaeon]
MMEQITIRKARSKDLKEITHYNDFGVVPIPWWILDVLYQFLKSFIAPFSQ